MIDYCMPSLGADMESAVLVEWLVKVGDKVASGDVVAVVETDKGAIEIQVFDETFAPPPQNKICVGFFFRECIQNDPFCKIE